MNIDSGAAVTEFPRDVGEGYEIVRDEKTGRTYCGAGAGSEIEDEGRRRINMYDEQWTLKPLTHRVANLFGDAIRTRRQPESPR